MQMVWTLTALGDVVASSPGAPARCRSSARMSIELAADQVVALREAGELLAGDDPGGEAAGDVEHAERGDEGRQPEAAPSAGR